MSAIMLRKSTGASYTLPAAGITGDNPETNYAGRGGDIVHERAGAKISVRCFITLHTWSIVLHGLSAADLGYLRVYFTDRTLDYQPTGSVFLQYSVMWLGGFNPVFESVGKYSLSFSLEQMGA